MAPTVPLVKKIEREITLDWIGGLLIIHMILVHIDQWADVYTIDRILFFFMPWFFYKAGIFHKIKDERIVIKDTFKRLLIPMITFSVIGQIIYTIKLGIRLETNLVEYLYFLKQIFILGAVSGNLALWFLGSLFLDKIIFNWLCLHNINVKIVIGVSFILAYVFSLISKQLVLPHYLGNVCFGMIFYALGYWLKDIKLSLPLLMGLSIGLILCSHFCFSVIDARTNSLISGYYLVAVPFELAAIIFINNIVQFVPKKLLELTKLHLLGRESMAYYVTHWIVIMICDIVCVQVLDIGRGQNYRGVIIVICIFTLPFFAYILNKYFSKYLGK